MQILSQLEKMPLHLNEIDRLIDHLHLPLTNFVKNGRFWGKIKVNIFLYFQSSLRSLPEMSVLKVNRLDNFAMAFPRLPICFSGPQIVHSCLNPL